MNLEIRLLGGFDVRVGGTAVVGFESKKVRTLLAWLALNRDGGSRAQLAALLWPDAPETSSRRNLRQALYNLRSLLSCGDGDPLEANRSAIRLRHDRTWVDARVFDRQLAESLDGERCRDVSAVVGAIQLYRGDLLAGMPPEGGAELEQWLLFEQERLRELALCALRALVAHLASRGELGQAALFARRQLELDPLSEEGHRSLMRLYAASGRRNRALAQYESCTGMLRMELGVEPLEETTRLYEQILSEELTDSGLAAEVAPECPSIPLVGRREPYGLLSASFDAACSSGFRVALVEGEAGIGKSRLVRAFLHDVATARGARVLLSRGRPTGFPVPYFVARDTLRSAVESAAGHGESVAPPATRDLAVLALLTPPERPALPWPAPPSAVGSVTRIDIARALAAFLRQQLVLPEVDALVLYCDDLQWVDPASLRLLTALGAALRDEPVWVVATARTASVGGPLTGLDEERIDRIRLERLGPPDLRQVTRSFLSEESAATLDPLLREASGGLPLAVVECINLLCDGDLLVDQGSSWRLAGGSDAIRVGNAGGLDRIISERVRHLPDSTRRLLSLAAVLGVVFPADLLETALHEHRVVVDAGIETLLGHWILRHSPEHWYPSRRQRDIVLWSQGVRAGRFEFAHERVRTAVYAAIHPVRRCHLHGAAARGLETLHDGQLDGVAADLAWHHLAAGGLATGLVWLRRAADQAAQLDAPDVAALLARRGLEIVAGDPRGASVSSRDLRALRDLAKG